MPGTISGPPPTSTGACYRMPFAKPTLEVRDRDPPLQLATVYAVLRSRRTCDTTPYIRILIAMYLV